MHRYFLAGLALTGLLLAPASGFAKRIAVPNYQTPQKVALSDAIVLGRVAALENETVELPQFPGDKTKIAFTVAIIKVESALLGAKNATHIKVAFLAQPVGGGSGVPGRIVRPPVGPIALLEGQEGIFFLQKHPGSDSYYLAPQGFAPLALEAANYKEELATVKTATAALAEPLKALRAEKPADRLVAASVLITKYRQPVRGGLSVEQAIPAKETKLILSALVEADWTLPTSPISLLSQIGLFPGANGLPQIVVKPGENYNEKWKDAVKTWSEKEGAKFEIKKFVAQDKK